MRVLTALMSPVISGKLLFISDLNFFSKLGINSFTLWALLLHTKKENNVEVFQMNGTKTNCIVVSMALLTVLWGAEEPEVITKEITNRKIVLVSVD